MLYSYKYVKTEGVKVEAVIRSYFDDNKNRFFVLYFKTFNGYGLNYSARYDSLAEAKARVRTEVRKIEALTDKKLPIKYKKEKVNGY